MIDEECYSFIEMQLFFYYNGVISVTMVENK